jgi:hypothetical protein
MKLKPLLFMAWAMATLSTMDMSFAGQVVSGTHGETSGQHRDGRQPYENSAAWQWVAPIDGSGYCGPASLYHIISYYGDFGSFCLNHRSGKKRGKKPVAIRGITRNNPLYVDDSDFGKYIQPNGMGSSWALMKKVANLCSAKNHDLPLYDIHVCSIHTKLKDTGIRRARLDFIRRQFLIRNIPVVIHLDGSVPFFGHYVTLIGYDPMASTVYYVDSLRHDMGIQTVTLEDFLGTWFYVSGKYYKARWDGEWMALWHTGDVEPCGRCGE